MLPRAALCALVVACGSQVHQLDRGIERGDLAHDVDTRHRTLVAQGDGHWQKRGERAELEHAIERWRAAVAIKDNDHATYEKLARAEYFLADAFLQFDAMAGDYPYNPDKTKDPQAVEAYRTAHRRGMDDALRGLAARSRKFEEKSLAGASPEQAVAVVGKAGIGLVFWYGANLARWAAAGGRSSLTANLGRIRSLILRVRRVDPDFFFASGDRYLGVYYAAVPLLLGGSLERSHEHFRRALEAAPEVFFTHVLVAEFYARRVKDAESFERHLRYVLDTDPAVVPELEPEFRVEQRKAALLLPKKARWFR